MPGKTRLHMHFAGIGGRKFWGLSEWMLELIGHRARAVVDQDPTEYLPDLETRGQEIHDGGGYRRPGAGLACRSCTFLLWRSWSPEGVH